MSGKANDSALENLAKENTGRSGRNNLSRSTTQLAKPNQTVKTSQTGRGRRKKRNVNAHLRQSARRIGGPNFTINLPLTAKGTVAPLDMPGEGVPRKSQSGRVPSMRLSASRLGMKHKSKGVIATPGVPMPEDLGMKKKGKLDRRESRSSMSQTSGSKQSLVVSAKETGGPGTKEQIIRYGELLKKSVTLKETWKSRFIIVTSKSIYYYENAFDVPKEFGQIDINPKGEIPLDTIENTILDKGDPTHQKFNVYTPSRTYRFEAGFQGGGTIWVGVITGAVENIKQQMHSYFRGGGRRESFSSVLADEVDTFNLSQNNMRASSVFGFRNAANQLRNEDQVNKSKAASKGPGPHLPASLEDYEKWSSFDVAAWLMRKGFGEYVQLFHSNKVDGSMLKDFNTKKHASDFGIKDEHIVEFLNAVEQLVNAVVAIE